RDRPTHLQPKASCISFGLCSVIISQFFFFQAEDGIRDHCVTGVQTCALPIFPSTHSPTSYSRRTSATRARTTRSEERRVGKSVDLGGRRIIKKKNIKQIK